MEFKTGESQNDLDSNKKNIFSSEKLEEIKKDFEKYESYGVPLRTYTDLLESLQKNLLTEKYEEAVEKLDVPSITISGFEKDIDSEIFLDFVNEHFKNELLQKGLISSIELHLDEINFQADKNNILNLQDGEYYIPEKVFEKYWESFNDEQKNILAKNIYRGENFSCWYINGHTNKKFYPSPVVLYSQKYDEKNRGLVEGKNLEDLGLEYLSNFPQEEIREKYVLGTLAHEIGHHIYVYCIFRNSLLKEEWREIIDECGNITKYANNYEEENIKDYDENFAEAIRIYTTNCDYLNDKYKKVKEFIKNYFEDLVKESN